MEGGGARPEPERLLVDDEEGDNFFLPLDPFPLLLREEEDIFIPVPGLDRVLRVFTIQSIGGDKNKNIFGDRLNVLFFVIPIIFKYFSIFF